MIRTLFAIMGALWLSGCGAPADSSRDWPEPSPAVWHVTAPGGEEGWLFGTVHSLPRGVEWRSPAFERAFAASGLLVVEIANLRDGGAATRSFEAVARTPGLPPLSERVAEADRPALAALLDRADRDDGDFGDVESWAAALMLSSAVRTSDPGSGVDRVLLAEGRRVAGLESFEAQYAMFDGLSEGAQSALLAGVATEARESRPAEQVEAWLIGNLDALDPAMSESFLGHPELREALLDGRNRDWAERVAQLVSAGEKPFVAVGAGHMLGESGLPALLASRGFTVERIG